MKRLWLLCLCLYVFTHPLLYAQDDIEELLFSGIAEKRQTPEGLQELLHEAATQLESTPNDYGLLWKLSALNYFFGEFYCVRPEEKKKYATLCKMYGEKAVKVNPKGVAGHYWLGVGMAKWAEANGILYSLFTADDILYEMNVVILLDPSFFKGLPWAIRASVYAMAPPIISVGDTAKARDDIKTAIYYGKDYRPTYLVCADVSIALGEWKNASWLIEKGLSLPYDTRMIVEENDCIRKLKERKERADSELAKLSR